MYIPPEVFKGIEYVRISNLPDDQRAQITLTLPKRKIIKILRERDLLKDCIQYGDYQKWYGSFKSRTASLLAEK